MPSAHRWFTPRFLVLLGPAESMWTWTRLAVLTSQGQTESAALPTTSNAFQRVAGGGPDVFVAKLTPVGDRLSYSTYLGGTSEGQRQQHCGRCERRRLRLGRNGVDRLPADRAGAGHIIGWAFRRS